MTSPLDVLRRFPAALFAAAVLVLAGLAAQPAAADNTQQCQAGPNDAIVNACRVRYEAANVRAHIAANQYGGSSAACLNDTADLLVSLGTVWIAQNKYVPFAGAWPCGRLPQVAGADDGVLARACPNAVWSYEDRGNAGCSGSALVAKAVPAAVATPYVAPYVAPAPYVPPPPDPFIGAWLNNYGVTETFHADGTALSSTNNSTGTWRAEGGGRYRISWAAGSQYDVEATISADGRTFTWYEPNNTTSSTGGTATKQ